MDFHGDTASYWVRPIALLRPHLKMEMRLVSNTLLERKDLIVVIDPHLRDLSAYHDYRSSERSVFHPDAVGNCIVGFC
jgi:hypothetical protein